MLAQAAEASRDGLLHQLETLTDHLEVLDKTIDMLTGLLGPVTRPHDAEPSREEVPLKKVVPMSSATHRVMAATEGVIHSNERLHVLMSRVDL